MSVSASIDIRLAMVEGCLPSAVEIINSLLRCNWTTNDNEKISYLPLGDNDAYDWQNESICSEHLVEIINEKERQNEVIGVVLTWEKSDIGMHILVLNNRDLSFNLSMNRKRINDDLELNMTDVNWYLERIMPAFRGENYIVESVTFEQHI